ncbi:hypothetical protein BGZ80_008249 [Entomortierella chlamydospora]|uniref:HTH CENPB-type domain-containing protein n=1 Tax=Entomortierella chlamydospora TaxID=101097 RepID=A0A9P6T1Q1_9FUNG|nr:hypothetical protein BGZ79_009862 [Entomortierella chlamydospora]KAG0017478.1 hypothetical protein BGZ80_008249 [Entomortierella chlamydospora]
MNTSDKSITFKASDRMGSPRKSSRGQDTGRHERLERGNSDIFGDLAGDDRQATRVPPLVSTLPHIGTQVNSHKVADEDKTLEPRAPPTQNPSADVGGQTQVSNSLQKALSPAERMTEPFSDTEHSAGDEHEGQDQHHKDFLQYHGNQQNLGLYSATADLEVGSALFSASPSVPQVGQHPRLERPFPLSHPLSQVDYASASSTSTLKRPTVLSGSSNNSSRGRKFRRGDMPMHGTQQIIQQPQAGLAEDPRSDVSVSYNQQQSGNAELLSLDGNGQVATPQSMDGSPRRQLNESPELSPLKKKRAKLTNEERRWIIAFHEKNPDMTDTEIGKKVGRPRTTVTGVIKNKDDILAEEPSKDCRRVKPRKPEVEIALARWVEDEESRGKIISPKHASKRAKKIHDEIYREAKDPPSGEYASSWLKGFEKRYRPLKKIADLPSQADKEAWQGLIDDCISKCEPEEIYYCHVTSMRQDAVPTRDPYNGNATRPFASVLLSCNAAGTVLLDPIVGYSQVRPDTVGESPREFGGLTSSSIEQWLMDLDERVSKPTLLLASLSMWSTFDIALPKRLKFVILIHVPESINSLLPMGATLVKEFKGFFYKRQHSTTWGQAHVQGQVQREYRLDLIKQAWHDIQGSSIKRSVENSKKVVAGLLKGSTL